jgi:hypothetical protein
MHAQTPHGTADFRSVGFHGAAKCTAYRPISRINPPLCYSVRVCDHIIFQTLSACPFLLPLGWVKPRRELRAIRASTSNLRKKWIIRAALCVRGALFIFKFEHQSMKSHLRGKFPILLGTLTALALV